MEETSLLPCLLIQKENHSDQQTFLTFYSFSEKTLKIMIISELSNKYVLGSAFGWLVLVDHNTNNCSLWNPSSTQIIELPQLEESRMYDRCILSRPPTNPDCYVLFTGHGIYQLAFLQLGDDEFVIKSFEKEEKLSVYGAVSFRGEIYCFVMELFSNLESHFVTAHFTSRKTLELRPIFTWGPNPSRILKTYSKSFRYYLVKSPCGGELFFIYTTSWCTHVYETGLDFRIFRIDVDQKEGVELENIGKRAFFLTHADSSHDQGHGVCYSSNEVIKANSIYYTVPNSKNLYRYDLDTQTYMEVPPFTTASCSKSTSLWVDYQVFKEYILKE